VDKTDQYIEKYSSTSDDDENALLNELERATNQKVLQPKMVSGRVQGAFLTLITKLLRPQRVLEIGTFTGYSALAIAAGLDEDAEIHTVEIDDELEDIARSFFDRSRHGHKIRLHIGSALDITPRLVASQSENNQSDEEKFTFDLIFIDGDKREYPDYYRMVMGDAGGTSDERRVSMVRPGTIILADNVLWYGKVAEIDTKTDIKTATATETSIEITPQTAIATLTPTATETKNVTATATETATETETETETATETATKNATATATPAITTTQTFATTATSTPLQTHTKPQSQPKNKHQTVDKDAKGVKSDSHTAGIAEFNRIVAADPRVENVILPLRDGINLIRVK
jgi:caffeoyl-CoA O-methyltransferase